MPKRIKIVTFINDREGREQGEDELTRLVNEGYKIVGSGGGTGAEMVWGFVILEKETTDEVRDTKTLLQLAMEDDEADGDTTDAAKPTATTTTTVNTNSQANGETESASE